MGPPLERVSRANDLELSFGQELVWLLEQIIPEARFYNLVERFSIKGRLDVELLRRCIDAVIKRQEILRTVYPVIAGRPVQRVEPPYQCSLDVVDLFGVPLEDREHGSAALDRGQRQEGLRSSSAIRSYVRCCCNSRTRDTFWRPSSIISRSMAGRCGCSFMRSRPSTRHSWKAETPKLASLPIQYADFAHWQRRWMTGDVLAERRGLSGATNSRTRRSSICQRIFRQARAGRWIRRLFT